MRRMAARFPGTCRKCRAKINPGDRIVFVGKGNSFHNDCYGGDAEEANAPNTGNTPGAVSESGNSGLFHLEWSDLRDTVLDAMRGKFPLFRVADNRKTFKELCQKEEESFRGYSLSQAKDWAVNGYETDALKEIQDFAPPLREKRQFVYHEDGDEIDLSAAWSGEDVFMTGWTPEEVIPGVSIEFYVNLYAGVDAKVVNSYIHWIAQAIYAIEDAGIDPEISFAVQSEWRWTNRFKKGVTRVRVKKEMETVDANFWSAMISPAAFRTFGFAAIVLAADSVNAAAGLGIDAPNREQEWDVKYEREEGKVMVTSPWSASLFPEEEMTRKLRQAIEELKQG